MLTPYICIFMSRLINKSREFMACGLSPFFIPVFILFSAYVEAVEFRSKSLCGRNACLSMVKEESYTEIKVSPKTRNFVEFFMIVKLIIKTLFPFAMLFFVLAIGESKTFTAIVFTIASFLFLLLDCMCRFGSWRQFYTVTDESENV